mmetsp:Transcript_10395/g.25823  ORF Transcript_10395/g.25823 Transcript_10395/m.25823 type:complete len:251 (+) Transcript_10395:624-1376(+)
MGPAGGRGQEQAGGGDHDQPGAVDQQGRGPVTGQGAHEPVPHLCAAGGHGHRCARLHHQARLPQGLLLQEPQAHARARHHDAAGHQRGRGHHAHCCGQADRGAQCAQGAGARPLAPVPGGPAGALRGGGVRHGHLPRAGRPEAAPAWRRPRRAGRALALLRLLHRALSRALHHEQRVRHVHVLHRLLHLLAVGAGQGHLHRGPLPRGRRAVGAGLQRDRGHAQDRRGVVRGGGAGQLQGHQGGGQAHAWL